MNERAEELRRSAAAFGVVLSSEQAAQLVRLGELVLAANAEVRLTAITAWEQMLAKHFLDSLAPLALGLMSEPGEMAADLGSGGGFPGLVLASVLPGTRFTLIEATNKKARFLAEAARELGLDTTSVWSRRAEEAGEAEGREVFTLATARALAELRVLIELAHPLLRVGGVLLAWKGPEGPEEVEQAQGALSRLGAVLTGMHPYDLPGGMGRRFLIALRKTAPTPAGFPRRPGMANKRPL